MSVDGGTLAAEHGEIVVTLTPAVDPLPQDRRGSLHETAQALADCRALMSGASARLRGPRIEQHRSERHEHQHHC